MSTLRIALANLPYPETPEAAVALAEEAIANAGSHRADIICFPECYVPGYRAAGWYDGPPDPLFLARAWSTVAAAAGRANVAVVLGTERLDGADLRISALVVNRDGTIAGFQDKTQIDPSEEGLYVAASSGRQIFQCGDVTFGIAICHEGFRYPETVRWAARQGAQIVFHPHFHWANGDSYRAATFGDPANSFHEKAALCRAAENTIYFATVNYATEESGTTSAIVKPDGSVLAWQPYGKAGLLVADLDLSAATGLPASRLKPVDHVVAL